MTYALSTGELIAKVEAQFQRGLLTADDLASEMTSIVRKAAQAAKEQEESLRPHVVTIRKGSRAAVSSRYSDADSAGLMVRDYLEGFVSTFEEFITAAGTHVITGTWARTGESATIISEVICIANEEYDCPCKKCQD